jgi:glutaredoxin
MVVCRGARPSPSEELGGLGARVEVLPTDRRNAMICTAFVLLRRWWQRWSGPPGEPLQVVLYTRRGCHLCDDAWQRLRKARRRHGFTLTTVDVDTDAELVARFGETVPVVAVNGKVRFRGAVNEVLLTRLFRAAARREPR